MIGNSKNKIQSASYNSSNKASAPELTNAIRGRTIAPWEMSSNRIDK
jgi:hypothetical protein